MMHKGYTKNSLKKPSKTKVVQKQKFLRVQRNLLQRAFQNSNNELVATPKSDVTSRKNFVTPKTKFLEEKEDLGFCFYVSGFIDGEGCFTVSFRKLSKMKLGIEVRPSFSVGQNKTKKNYALLMRIQALFQGGGIRSDTKRNGFYKYETRSLSHLCNRVIPFFITYPLYTQKSEDFDYFCKICSLLAAKQHLNLKGLLQIIDLAEKMNPSGTRRLLLSEIRLQLLKKTET